MPGCVALLQPRRPPNPGGALLLACLAPPPSTALMAASLCLWEELVQSAGGQGWACASGLSWAGLAYIRPLLLWQMMKRLMGPEAPCQRGLA